MAKRKSRTPTDLLSAVALGALKGEVNAKVRDLIETVLKPRHIKPPTGHPCNYLVDITTQWLGSKCYFLSVYACPGPNALSPTLEAKFARLAYVGDGRFALAFRRHTGRWVELAESLSVDECIQAIREIPWLEP